MRNRGFAQLPIIIAIVAGIIAVGGVGYLGYRDFVQSKNSESTLAKQQQALDDAQKEIEALKSQNQQTEPAQQKQPSTSNNLQSSVSTISSSEIVKYLDGVMQISCGQVSGSLSLWKFSDGIMPTYAAITNGHVADDATGHCLLLPGSDSDSTVLASVNPAAGKDWNNFTDITVLNIDQAFVPSDSGFTQVSKDRLNYSISSLPKCSTKMPVGSPVITVGYPAFGMQEHNYSGIVATASHRIISNGIISGYSEADASGASLPYKDYYVSAKIDSGNSGGIAFSKTANGLCVLGVPTWIGVGNYETNGLVQNIHNVMSR